MSIDPNKSYTAILKTGKGDITIELFAKDAPITVDNFAKLARQGFYDNTTFHRVLQGFMAQGGDPTGTGTGGPGYNIPDEIEGNPNKHETGVISMANKGTPNSGGSQFFITFVPTPHLDGAHTVFGKVVEGMDVVLSLSLRDPARATTPGDALHTVEIIEE